MVDDCVSLFWVSLTTAARGIRPEKRSSSTLGRWLDGKSTVAGVQTKTQFSPLTDGSFSRREYLRMSTGIGSNRQEW